MTILDLELTELAGRIAAGEITSVAATRACLERLETIGRTLNCIVSLWAETALRAAERADLAVRNREPSGPLHGVPLAHKDLFYRQGAVVAGGSKIRAGFTAPTTATVLQRLDKAGAIHVGALHMSEFALSPTGYNKHLGHCRNPWNLDYVTGGSSSGSGAAVAARLTPASLGSDTGGSIRLPAAICGVTGLKPTHTLVSTAGVMPLAHSLDCVGPLARTARDCARVLGVIAGPDAADPRTHGRPELDYEGALDGNVRGLRIAVPRGRYLDHVNAEVLERLDESLAVFRELGAVVVDTTLDDIDEINDLNKLVLMVEAATLHRKWLIERPQDYSEAVRGRLESGLHVPATRYVEALSLRGMLAARFIDHALADADLVLLPALPHPVPTIAEAADGLSPDISPGDDIVRFTRALNYLGLPAISVPAGFTRNGLPSAFQLAGRHFQEAMLLRAADAYQRVTGWHRQEPPITAVPREAAAQVASA